MEEKVQWTPIYKYNNKYVILNLTNIDADSEYECKLLATYTKRSIKKLFNCEWTGECVIVKEEFKENKRSTLKSKVPNEVLERIGIIYISKN